MSKMFLFESLVIALLLLTAKKFQIDALIRFASTQFKTWVAGSQHEKLSALQPLFKGTAAFICWGRMGALKRLYSW